MLRKIYRETTKKNYIVTLWIGCYWCCDNCSDKGS